MTSVLRVALTGGIGSGKTTVANQFEKLGTPIIDSDIIARNVVTPGQPCLKKIIHTFDNELLTKQGELNREKLRNIIFNDSKAKEKLEQILHPAIYEEIEKQIAEINYPYCLIVIPLLIETNAMDRFDRILVVDTAEKVQIQRAQQRDNTSEENIERIIKSQVNRQQRLKYADDIIENNLSIEGLNSSVKILHEKYINLSSYKPEKNK
ncbi:MAG: dephospho-CoA kinase [Gammaproteobacteria bacterium]|jgi:dephospho-CoA kinase